ncbi:hypothetical protein Tco_0538079 [Tanacetum coccineum]
MGDLCFRVKDVRRILDDMHLPKSDVPSIWVQADPHKVNVLLGKNSMDLLYLLGLISIGVEVSDSNLILGYLGYNEVQHQSSSRNKC